MPRILLYLSLIIAAVITACSSSANHNSENIQQIDQVLDQRQWQRAQSMLDRAVDAADLSAHQYGKLSIQLMRLSEALNEDENIAAATQCYLRAFALQPDSALDFYSSLPLDYSRYVAVMAQLSHAITSPIELDEEPDSIIDMPEHQHID